MELALIALILGAAAFLLGLCLLVEITRGTRHATDRQRRKDP